MTFQVPSIDRRFWSMSMLTNNQTQFCSDPDANGNTEAWGAGPHWLKNEVLHHTPFIASGSWMRDAAANPGLSGVIYTTWENKYDRLEAFAESVKQERERLSK